MSPAEGFARPRQRRPRTPTLKSEHARPSPAATPAQVQESLFTDPERTSNGAEKRGEKMSSPILQPVVVLVLWSLVMWAWLYATRIPAMQKAGVVLDPNLPPADLAAKVPPNVRWKADNYNHLMEQPTIFYATALALAVMGQGDGFNAALAWGYVGLRIVHSLVQATVNTIMLRFAIFMVSTLVLLALAIHAAMSAF
jgi:hypothetical protein